MLVHPRLGRLLVALPGARLEREGPVTMVNLGVGRPVIASV
jgi:hypothetical protein